MPMQYDIGVEVTKQCLESSLCHFAMIGNQVCVPAFGVQSSS